MHKTPWFGDIKIAKFGIILEGGGEHGQYCKKNERKSFVQKDRKEFTAKYTIVINGVPSSSSDLTQSIPHGSVLGPKLYNIRTSTPWQSVTW